MSKNPMVRFPHHAERRSCRYVFGVLVAAGLVGFTHAARADWPDSVGPDRSQPNLTGTAGNTTDGEDGASRAGKRSFEPPWFELGIAPGLEVGRGVFATFVVSYFLTVRTWEGLRLGLSLTPAYGTEDGLEGCSTVSVCDNERLRASGRAEYQFNFTWVRPWLAAELGREHWKGVDMLTGDHPKVSGVRTVGSIQAGIDAVVRGAHKGAGLGLFLGFNKDERSAGFGVGIRLTLGPY